MKKPQVRTMLKQKLFVVKQLAPLSTNTLYVCEVCKESKESSVNSTPLCSTCTCVCSCIDIWYVCVCKVLTSESCNRSTCRLCKFFGYFPIMCLWYTVHVSGMWPYLYIHTKHVSLVCKVQWTAKQSTGIAEFYFIFQQMYNYNAYMYVPIRLFGTVDAHVVV